MNLEDIRTQSQRAIEFERLLAQLFEQLGFQVTPNPTLKTLTGFLTADLLIKSEHGPTAILEAKLFSSRTMPMSVLTSVFKQLESHRRWFEADKGILATGIQIPNETKDRYKSIYPAILIYDLDVLMFLFARFPALQKRFEELTRESLTFSDPPEAKPAEVDVEADLKAPLPSKPSSPTPPPEPEEQRGTKLCNELRDIPAGKRHAKAFEKKMIDVLKYLFEDDLTAWSPQRSTDSGISLYDVVARVNSSHDFWRALVNHFYSRYVVFEFKNYGGRIKQGQMHTTEKYLYRTALRSTAIIISRKGADKNAHSVCRGALREHGKLILNLTIDDVCKMLHLRDVPGGDYNGVLTDYADNMLMRLER